MAHRGKIVQILPLTAVRSLPFVRKLSFMLFTKTLVFGCWHGAQLC